MTFSFTLKPLFHNFNMPFAFALWISFIYRKAINRYCKKPLLFILDMLSIYLSLCLVSIVCASKRKPQSATENLLRYSIVVYTGIRGYCWRCSRNISFSGTKKNFFILTHTSSQGWGFTRISHSTLSTHTVSCLTDHVWVCDILQAITYHPTHVESISPALIVLWWAQ